MTKGIAIWLSVLLSCASATGHAGERASDVRKTAEASMLVTGTVQVNPDGTLHAYTVDQPDVLPAPVVDLINRNVPRWTFALDGKPDGVITSRMSLRILAKPIDDKNFNLTIQGASFGDNGLRSGTTVHFKERQPPRYPREAVDGRVSGTVYLLERIGRDGTVQEVIAEQVNLDQYGGESEMERFRDVLAHAAVNAARSWTYNLPTEGKEVDAPYWVVRVPVVFNLNPANSPTPPRRYGSWRMYIPGPKQQAPWITNQAMVSSAPDAVPDGGLQMVGSGLRLTSPLGGS